MSHQPVHDEPIKGEDMASPVKPVESPAFWQQRIYSAFAKGGMLHQAILDDSYELWNYLQGETAGILLRHVPVGSKVLDAGCGYGALLGCFEEIKMHLPPDDYLGVDISPDLIRLARERYPQHRFTVGDLRNLRMPDKAFDWCVCRSVQGMIRKNVGQAAWDEMERELLRVSKRLLLMGYPEKVGGPIEVEVKS